MATLFKIFTVSLAAGVTVIPKQNDYVLNLIKGGVSANMDSSQTSTVNVWGLDFVSYPTHFQLSVWHPSGDDYFQQFLAAPVNGTFLEIGCGPGQYSIRAALNGADHVTAIDINPQAVENALENAQSHNLDTNTYTAFESDIFNSENLNNKTFDQIFWNFPFIYLDDEKELNPVERGVFDPEYKMLHRYLSQAGNYLNENGTLYITWSRKLANEMYLKQVAGTYGWNMELYEEIETTIDESTKFQLWKLTQLNTVGELEFSNKIEL